MKILPTKCPACHNPLIVKSLVCDECKTEVQGQYQLPPLASFSPEDQEFILNFLKVSGSLKDMAKLLQLSYPTVRNRLDEIIGRIKLTEQQNNTGKENQ